MTGVICHAFREIQVRRIVHNNFEFVAFLEDGLPRWLMGFRRESDPVEIAAKQTHSAGFKVPRKIRLCKSVGECCEVVLQRLTTGDHGEIGSISSCVPCFLGQLFRLPFWMDVLRPGMFCIAPRTAHIATGEPDEERTSTAVMPLPLKRMKGFYNGIQCAFGLMWWGGQSLNASRD